MADQQSQLMGGGSADSTAKICGLLVVGAVATLFLLKRLSVSVNVGS